MPDENAETGDQEQEAQADEQEQSGVTDKERSLMAEAKKYRLQRSEAQTELAKLQDANKKAELEALETAGEFKEKNELLTADNERLTAIEKEWSADKEAQKEELLESLPEDKREAYKDFSLTQLRIVAKDLKIQPKVEVNTQTPGSPNMTDTQKAIQELTQQFSESQITHSQYKESLTKLRAN